MESIQLHYSKFCTETREMVIYATEGEMITGKTFDPKTRTFSLHLCCLDTCKEIDQCRKTFEFGNQGLQYRRYHRDSHSNPLMCLAVTWRGDKRGGLMDVFCNAKGEIGRYTWNEDLKCFDRAELLDASVSPFEQHVDLLRKNPSLMMTSPTIGIDKDLIYCGSANCKELDEDVLFLFNKETFRTKQYIFNQDRRQFEKVDLPDIIMDTDKDGGKDVRLCYNNMYLTTRMGAPIEKFWFSGMQRIEEGAAPIRDICHLSLEQIVDRKTEQRKITLRESDCFEENGVELWFLVAGASIEGSLVADLKGGVVPFYEVDLMQMSPKKTITEISDQPKGQSSSRVSTSDLSPIEWLSRRNFVFSARNAVTDRVETFKYDSSEDCIRHIDWDTEWIVKQKSSRMDFGPGYFVKRGSTVTLLKADEGGRLEVRDYRNFQSSVRGSMEVEMLNEASGSSRQPTVSFFCDGFFEAIGSLTRVPIGSTEQEIRAAGDDFSRISLYQETTEVY